MGAYRLFISVTPLYLLVCLFQYVGHNTYTGFSDIFLTTQTLISTPNKVHK